MTQYGEKAAEILRSVRSAKPVVHSITNYVVMNSTANVLLAMGAAPIMAHAAEEMEELIGFPGAVVINIGTLSGPWIESMKTAARLCGESNKPYILDPVGAGATKLRTDTAKDLIETAIPAVIRGNASEILSLSPEGGATRGVDSMNTMEQALNAARILASSLGTVVAVTGERDLVTNGTRSLIVSGGHALMGSVTGTGCAATVIVAAFTAQGDDPLVSAATALAYYGLAGSKAAVEAKGPGSFWVNVLDQLYSITPEELASEVKIEAV